jgi:hypothetical protein
MTIARKLANLPSEKMCFQFVCRCAHTPDHFRKVAKTLRDEVHDGNRMGAQLCNSEIAHETQISEIVFNSGGVEAPRQN